MRRLAILAAALGVLAVAGPNAVGKLALMAGLPSLAARLIDDPAARGVALYRAGDYAGADRAFADAGRSSTYNRGLSLAMTGDYALSRAYFEAVLFANPADGQARDNRAVVDALAPRTIGEGNESGRIATTVAPADGPPVELFSAETRPLDEGTRVADDAWLSSLSDDPAEFLRLRLADERTRRDALGLGGAEEADPW